MIIRCIRRDRPLCTSEFEVLLKCSLRGVHNIYLGLTCMTFSRSGRFDESEDAILLDMVSRNGARNWTSIAAALPGRSARQCRDRYSNYLAPEINRSSWTDEEERLLIEKHQEYGPKWSLIAQFFENRSTNCLKNHWNYKCGNRKARRRTQRAKPKEKVTTAEQDEVIEKLFPGQELSSSYLGEWDEYTLLGFDCATGN